MPLEHCLNLRQSRARGVLPGGYELGRLHEFIPQNMVNVRLDENVCG